MLDVLIIGAGPSGLMAADDLSRNGYDVTILDRMPSPARKFLMAGRGGLNLTHSEDRAAFLGRYREAEPFLTPFIEDFCPEDLVGWCEALGQETFVGTSGRIFPKTMKASPLLRAWLRRLDDQGVTLKTRHTFCGLSATGAALIRSENKGPVPYPARAVLLALGGASWPKLGSDASWVPTLRTRGLALKDFQPANCGFLVAWSDVLKDRFAGHPLKQIALSIGPRSVLGEAMMSEQGLEGSAIYALSAEIRDSIRQNGEATIGIDLRPALSLNTVIAKLSRPRGKQSMATFLKKTLRLKPVEQALLRETGPLPHSPEGLAERIKSVAVTCHAPYLIDRAISSAGGIALNDVDEALMLRKCPGVFVAGEMLDWEAPTGGYLLQACFATGKGAARGIAAYLNDNAGDPLG